MFKLSLGDHSEEFVVPNIVFGPLNVQFIQSRPLILVFACSDLAGRLTTWALLSIYSVWGVEPKGCNMVQDISY